jgi:hypothetical protein
MRYIQPDITHTQIFSVAKIVKLLCHSKHIRENFDEKDKTFMMRYIPYYIYGKNKCECDLNLC